MTASSLYKTTIGLEIHAELQTNTKMFCACKNDADEDRANVNVCPICMGHPGTLPVINKQAVKNVLKVGIAVGGKIPDFTEFDRKNYFYPDIPKGYQISQYKYPLVSGGSIAGIELTRIHLEEDTAKSSHDTGNYSLVDFNRSSVPLMELVTEPVIHDAQTAVQFAKEFQLLLRYLGVGHANMEKGEMRVEANISVSKDFSGDPKKFGTKVEVKNLNSFKAVEKAIEYEVARHIEILEELEKNGGVGETIAQETRGWNEDKQETFSQRAKENSNDYRYFPDPDLPKLYISQIPEFSKDILSSELAELPWQRRARYTENLKLKNQDAEVLVSNTALSDYFEKIILSLKDEKEISLTINYLLSDYVGLLRSSQKDIENSEVLNTISPVSFAEIISMVSGGQLSSRGAKDMFAIIFTEGLAVGQTPQTLAESKGLIQKNDEGALLVVVQQIISAHPNVVADYKAGKESALMFFVGQAMKATKGSGNPAILKEIFLKLLT